MEIGYRVPDMDIPQDFDARNDVSDLTRSEIFAGGHIRSELAKFQNFVRGSGLHEIDLLSFADRSFHDTDVSYNTSVVVILAVEDQCPQRVRQLSFRSWNSLDDGIKYGIDPNPGFPADTQAPFGIQPHNGFDLFQHFVNASDGQIDLVQNGNNFQVRIDRSIGIRNGLRLYTLKGIDQQQRPFARGEAT